MTSDSNPRVEFCEIPSIEAFCRGDSPSPWFGDVPIEDERLSVRLFDSRMVLLICRDSLNILTGCATGTRICPTEMPRKERCSWTNIFGYHSIHVSCSIGVR
jgi:hypothetical protein